MAEYLCEQILSDCIPPRGLSLGKHLALNSFVQFFGFQPKFCSLDGNS